MLSEASDLSLCDSTLGATIAGNESERRKWSRKTGQGPNTRTARAYAEAILSLHALKTFFASQGATPPDPSPVTKSEGCPSSARDNLVQPSRALQVVKAKVAKTEALDRDADVILCELQDTYNNIVATTYISLLGQFNRWLIFAFVMGPKWCLFAAKAVILGILALLAARPRYDVVAFFAVLRRIPWYFDSWLADVAEHGCNIPDVWKLHIGWAFSHVGVVPICIPPQRPCLVRVIPILSLQILPSTSNRSRAHSACLMKGQVVAPLHSSRSGAPGDSTLSLICWLCLLVLWAPHTGLLCSRSV